MVKPGYYEFMKGVGKPFKAFREKIASGDAGAPGSAPKGAAPKAATDAKKGA